MSLVHVCALVRDNFAFVPFLWSFMPQEIAGRDERVDDLTLQSVRWGLFKRHLRRTLAGDLRVRVVRSLYQRQK